MKNPNEKIIAQNRSAYHNYFVEEVIECGLVLTGTEIKSIRLGKVSINDCYCDIKHNEMYVVNMHISPYDNGNIFNHKPIVDRKLLLHKKQIIQLSSKVSKNGYTLIPLKIALRNSIAKMDIGLCKGKKLYDKREASKEKTMEKEKEEY